LGPFLHPPYDTGIVWPEYTMFKSIGKSLEELSNDLRDRQDWEVGTLRTLDRVLDVNTFAFDPVSSILAVGELLVPPYFIGPDRCHDIDRYY
jgi:hypothetical protein